MGKDREGRKRRGSGKWEKRETRRKYEENGHGIEEEMEREKERRVRSCTILVIDESPKVASLLNVHLSLHTLPTITSTPSPMVC